MDTTTRRTVPRGKGAEAGAVVTGRDGESTDRVRAGTGGRTGREAGAKAGARARRGVSRVCWAGRVARLGDVELDPDLDLDQHAQAQLHLPLQHRLPAPRRCQGDCALG